MKAETEAPLDVGSQQKMAESAWELTGDSPWSFWAGPTFLLCALAISAWVNLQEMPYWLLASVLGMVFCVYYRMRGCVYSILLLAAFSAVRHGLFLDQHLLYFGLEGSLACSFFIMALAMDQRNSSFQSFFETSQAQKRAISHLEQNLAKLLESSQSQQVSLQGKIAGKQKELEDVQSELSSILVLNEVLRKTTATQLKESQQKADTLLDRERRIAYLISEREQLELQLEKLQSDSGLIQDNEKLLEDLNQVRCDYAQLEMTHGHLLDSYQEKSLYAEQIEKKCEELSQEKEKLEERLELFEEKNEELESIQEEEKKSLEEKLSLAQQESISRLSELNKLEQKMVDLQELLRNEKTSWEGTFSQQKKVEEDLYSEIGSLNTLNETLRSIADGHRQEIQDKEDLIAELLTQKEELAQNLEELRNESLLVQANAKLTEELNTKGYQLAELKTAYQNVSYLQDKQARHAEETHQQLCAFSMEKQALQNEIGSLKAENQMLKAHLQQLSQEQSNSSTILQKLEKLQSEKNFLQERLGAAELEIQMAANRSKESMSSAPKESPSLLAEREALLEKLSLAGERLSTLEERLKKAAQVEALYQQLRAQFEEKNTVLHDTRAQLFHADTELQKLRMEKEQKDLGKDPLEGHIEEVVIALEQQISDLQSENEELQEMIAQLLKNKS